MPLLLRKFRQAWRRGWHVNVQQQKVVRFKPDASTVHAEWVAVRTYSWRLLSPPVPLTWRRMLRHNAIETMNTMKRQAGNHSTHATALSVSRVCVRL